MVPLGCGARFGTRNLKALLRLQAARIAVTVTDAFPGATAPIGPRQALQLA